MSGPKLRIVKDGEEPDDPALKGKDCFVLKPDNEKKTHDRFISKFGDLPYLVSKEWPVCLGCKKPLSFVFQLRTDDAKGFLSGFPKMLSMFYCFSCNPWWDVDSKGFLISMSPIDGNADFLPAKKIPLEVFKEVRPVAINMEKTIDYPSLQDDEHFKDYNLNIQEMLNSRFPNITDSKLSGYTSWLTKPDKPKCRYCNSEMDFLAQISSGEFHGVQWPDKGRLFIFACQKQCKTDAFSIVIQSE